jgi:hypothetical protein
VRFSNNALLAAAFFARKDASLLGVRAVLGGKLPNIRFAPKADMFRQMAL